MIKDRFGGLFSVLNKRDVETLNDLHRWHELKGYAYIDTDFFETYQKSDNTFIDSPTIGDYLTLPTEELVENLEELDHALRMGCQQYAVDKSFRYSVNVIEEFDEDIASGQGKSRQIQECRWWLAKLQPILQKLRREVRRIGNGALN